MTPDLRFPDVFTLVMYLKRLSPPWVQWWTVWDEQPLVWRAS